jgi:hypothetical protein
MTGAGFPHSDTPGSTLRCQLPRAYRRLVRPSSALDAKASTMCPLTLVTQTLNKNNDPPPNSSEDAVPESCVRHNAKRPDKQKHAVRLNCSTYTSRTNTQPRTHHTTRHAKRARQDDGAKTLVRSRMLASTVQQPNTTPTNPHPTQHTDETKKGGTEVTHSSYRAV